MCILLSSSLQGDYGGPLMCRLPGQENWKLFGIASWGRQITSAFQSTRHSQLITGVLNYNIEENNTILITHQMFCSNDSNDIYFD